MRRAHQSPLLIAGLALIVLACLYVFSSGPVVWLFNHGFAPAEVAILAYVPLLESIDDRPLMRPVRDYLFLWAPEGISLPIYKSSGDIRARELIYTSEELPQIVEIWEETWGVTSDVPNRPAEFCRVPM